MRVTREQAAENHDRIIEVAGRLFRERGFDGIGVADLMKAAGLTHGGFYGHFASKDDLAAQACERAATRSADLWRASTAGDGENRFAALVERYLSDRHRDNPGAGCLYAALGADVARGDNPPLRRAVTDGVRSSIDIAAEALDGRREEAIARVAGMVGALLLARAVDDPALSAEILSAGRAVLGREPGAPDA